MKLTRRSEPEKTGLSGLYRQKEPFKKPDAAGGGPSEDSDGTHSVLNQSNTPCGRFGEPLSKGKP
jgi:hypothetical protein